ncbi:amidase domain-containing protein [Streptomyces sp. NPDC048473]|uniref:amidase domain-containing protein n=1 Tax=unclassified Streptomyces TaxID=2593676 RepID=UPI0037156CAD
MVTPAATQLHAAEPPVAATTSMRAQLRQDFAALVRKGHLYQKVDGGYTRAAVKVTVADSATAGGIATLRVTEDTRLYLPFTAAQVAEGAPEYEEYSLPHTLTFTRGPSGGWLLASDKAELGGGPAPSTQIAPSADAPAPRSGGEGAKHAPSDTIPPTTGTGSPKQTTAARTMAAASYNYKAMVKYADKYWKKPNSTYRTYGSDCTNFISQVMRAGGWKIIGPTDAGQRSNNKKWFYTIYQSRTSYTWAGAENWYWFAIKHSKRTKPLNNVWKLGLADVLQANWKPRSDEITDHTMVVTKLYNGTPYLTYHTGTTHNKSLRKLIADHPNTAWYAHRT